MERALKVRLICLDFIGKFYDYVANIISRDREKEKGQNLMAGPFTQAACCLQNVSSNTSNAGSPGVSALRINPGSEWSKDESL